MSRLIVKNLPNGMKEERFRTMFAAFGTVTDCSLKFTKDGKFRKFGFVGFKTEEDANKALKHFDKSFVDTSRVTVEMCKAFGDPTKARAWSKHTQSTSRDKPSGPVDTDSKKRKNQKKEVNSTLSNLEEDQGFKEFMSVHQNRSQAPTWANDTVQQPAGPDSQRTKIEGKKKVASDDYLNFDSDQSEEEEQDDDDDDEEADEGTTKEALKSSLSDMEYLRSKVAQTEDTIEEGGEEDDGEDGDNKDEECGPVQQADSDYESGDRENLPKSKTAVSNMDKKQSKSKKTAKQETEPTTEFTVKLRGAPFSVKEQQVREFMTPLKPVAIRIGKNESGNRTGT